MLLNMNTWSKLVYLRRQPVSFIAFLKDKSIPTSLEWGHYNKNIVQTLRLFLDNSILNISHGFNGLEHEYMVYISPF